MEHYPRLHEGKGCVGVWELVAVYFISCQHIESVGWEVATGRIYLRTDGDP